MTAPPSFEQDDARQLARDLLGPTDDAVLVVDRSGVVQFASPAVAALLDHDPSSLEGLDVFRLAHPEDLERAMELFGSLGGDGREGFELGVRLETGSGAWVRLRASASIFSTSTLGAIGLRLRPEPDEEVALRETAYRRKIAVEGFRNRLNASFMRAADDAEILALIRSAAEELAKLVGADLCVVFEERRDRHALERVVRWVADEYADHDGLRELSFDSNPAFLDRVLSDVYIADDLRSEEHSSASQVLASAESESVLGCPWNVDGQRGLVALTRFTHRRTWRDNDISLLREAADAIGRGLHLAQHLQLLERTYLGGPIGFAIRTWDGGLVNCNTKYLELLGVDREEVEQIDRFELAQADQRDWLRSQVARLASGDTDHVRGDVRLARSSAAAEWVRINAVPLHSEGSEQSYMLTSFEDITELKAQQQQLEYAARHDPLTGVLNRRALMEQLDGFQASQHSLPDLLIVDLDRFKLTNDSFGHLVGDRVLQEITARIVDQVRDIDLVARLGGDEFAIVVPTAGDEALYELAERLRKTMDASVVIDGRPMRQTISIGVAVGEDCRDPSELLVRADRAMYAAKDKGRNDVVVFDASMRDAALERVATERDLRTAVERNELEVHFQPEFSLCTGEIVGAEALVRWRHPTRGMLAAGAFIEVAERSGLIDEIGRFALREACRTFVEGPGIADSSLLLRINLSAQEFSRPDLPDLVGTTLEQTTLAPQRLCLEMTETTLMDSPQIVGSTFESLRRIGVHFAIDDFGTGYSSLLYLKRYPVDALKIDRSFVQDLPDDPESRAIVESIVGLGRALSLEVVAEGIDSPAQLDLLRELGVERGQGYLVAPALPADEFVEFLRHHSFDPAA